MRPPEKRKRKNEKKKEEKQVGPTPVSNSILKCVLGPKRFWVKKSVRSQKILVLKKIASKKVFGLKNE